MRTYADITSCARCHAPASNRSNHSDIGLLMYFRLTYRTYATIMTSCARCLAPTSNRSNRSDIGLARAVVPMHLLPLCVIPLELAIALLRQKLCHAACTCWDRRRKVHSQSKQVRKYVNMQTGFTPKSESKRVHIQNALLSAQEGSPPQQKTRHFMTALRA